MGLEQVITQNNLAVFMLNWRKIPFIGKGCTGIKERNFLERYNPSNFIILLGMSVFSMIPVN